MTTPTKEQLVNLIINSPTINKTLSKVTPDFQDDFIQFYWLTILELPEEKLQSAYLSCPDCLYKFAGGILRNQLISDKSPFYKKYREKKHDQNALNHYYDLINTDPDKVVDSHTQEKELVDKIRLCLNHIHPKKSVPFIEHYFNHKTIRQIAKETKIKYTSVLYSIRTAEKEIHQRLKEQGYTGINWFASGNE